MTKKKPRDKKRPSKAARAAKAIKKIAQAKVDTVTKEAQLICDMGNALVDLSQRVTALENVAGLEGPRGATGPQGERGERGSNFWGGGGG